MSDAVIEIRRAKSSDIPNVAAAERSYIDCPWNEKQIGDELTKDNSLFFVATVGDEFAGYLSAVRAADECEIANIAVVDSYRRKGVATKLLHSLINEAANLGVRSFFLLVGEHNESARRLYEKIGFTEVGRRKRYYGINDALSMRLQV